MDAFHISIYHVRYERDLETATCDEKILYFIVHTESFYQLEVVVAQWCNPLTLKSEQLGGVGSIHGRTPPLERHDKGSRNRSGLLYFCDPSHSIDLAPIRTYTWVFADLSNAFCLSVLEYCVSPCVGADLFILTKKMRFRKCPATCGRGPKLNVTHKCA